MRVAPSARPALVVASLALAVVPGGSARALAQSAGSVDPGEGDSAASQGSADLEALSAAVNTLDAGRTETALARLAPLAEQASGDVGLAARYHFGKALYRLGYLHAALAEFEGILAEGPDNRYFGASLEWCLFIGRKMVDDVAVSEVLVRHADGAFPERYRDEFAFRLARHHFTRALEKAAREAAPPPPPPPADEDDEGISFDEDLFGEGPVRPPERSPERSSDSRRGTGDDGGISFGEDLFGEDPASPADPEADPSEMSPAAHREAARRLVLRVSEGSKWYPRARFLEALGLVAEKRENEALAILKAVVEATSEPPDDASEEVRRRWARLRELAFFQLARLHFGAKQPSFSIFYYRKVDRDSRQWLDALYEASWAEYRLGRYERALGNLLTVNAPFFDDAYYPESLILKAVIYYENCRYEEAESIITDFLARYEPIFEALERMAAESRSPEGWYALLADLERADAGEGADAALLARVLEIALSDPELVRLSASIEEVADEIDRLERALAKAPLAGAPRLPARLEGLRTERARLQGAAGRAVERKLRTEARAVKQLIAQALRIRVETAKAEEGRLEATLTRRDRRPKSQAQVVVSWTDDEKLVWPFEGEYWRDELGTYELTLARSCR